MALTEVGDAEGAATSDDIVPDENDVAPDTTDPAPQPQTERTEAADSTIPATGNPASADDATDETVLSGDGAPLSTVAASNIAPDVSAIRANVLAHARAVIDLCRLAGQPQRAGRFLEDDASLDAVRAALLAAKAQAEPEITPHHPQPGRSSTTHPWGDVIARTFKQKDAVMGLGTNR
jgi:hypothetical protein